MFTCFLILHRTHCRCTPRMLSSQRCMTTARLLFVVPWTGLFRETGSGLSFTVLRKRSRDDLNAILLQPVILRMDWGNALNSLAPANGRLWNLRFPYLVLGRTFVAIVLPLRDWMLDCSLIRTSSCSFCKFGYMPSMMHHR